VEFCPSCDFALKARRYSFKACLPKCFALFRDCFRLHFCRFAELALCEHLNPVFICVLLSLSEDAVFQKAHTTIPPAHYQAHAIATSIPPSKWRRFTKDWQIETSPWRTFKLLHPKAVLAGEAGEVEAGAEDVEAGRGEVINTALSGQTSAAKLVNQRSQPNPQGTLRKRQV